MKTSASLKIFIFLLALIVVGLGLYSHFQSSWVKQRSPDKPLLYSGKIVPSNEAPYKLCEDENHELNEYVKKAEEKCPPIEMEHFFVAMAVICLILDVVSFLLSVLNLNMKAIDAIIHLVLGLGLLVGSILFIVSAVEIDQLMFPDYDKEKDNKFKIQKEEREQERNSYLMWPKIIAGGFGILQAICHFAVACAAFSQRE